MVDYKLLREFIDYDPNTGICVWRKRERHHFTSNRGCSVWNAKYAGTPVGSRHDMGHLETSIFKKKYLLHRLIWEMVYGYVPLLIDHINGDRTDNRLGNLREVDYTANARNIAVQRKANGLPMGVRMNSTGTKWVAYYTPAGRQIHLGTFSTLDEAVEARRAACNDADFHVNHGTRLSLGHKSASGNAPSTTH